jgi:NAD(P)-dependent dehydrogenase (short-subunit alcohol dehydrogenase family)
VVEGVDTVDDPRSRANAASEPQRAGAGADRRRQAILITGAASGIGRATARLFASRGWRVAAIDRNAQALEALQGELGEGAAWCRAFDIVDRPALLEAVDAFAALTGDRLDLLFNNAGIDAKGRFEEMTWEQIVAVVDVNLVAGLSLLHAAIPLLKKTEGSLCLSTPSASAIFGAPEMAVYSATKHALKGLTEALAVELAGDGVRVADILPGLIDTGMLAEVDKVRLPAEGMWRVLPAGAIADTVWAAYHGDEVHWYVPAELAGYDVEVTSRPKAARERRKRGLP